VDLSQLPGAQQALAYITQQVAAWESLPTALQATSAQAMAVQNVAVQTGDTRTANAMGLVLGGVGPILEQVNASGPLIGQVLTAVNTNTVDTTAVATALRLAAMMTAGFAAARSLNQTVQEAAATTLTQAQRDALAIGAPTAGASAAGWVVGGLGLVALVTWLKRRKKGRRT
jgi:hydroxyethylthiazole kinase-like sugar kinase family protein